VDELDAYVWDLPPLEIGTTIGVDELVGRSDHGALIVRSLQIFSRILVATVEILRAPDLADDDWIAAVAPADPVLFHRPHVTAGLSYETSDAQFEPMGVGHSGCNQHFCRSEFWVALRGVPTEMHVDWTNEVEGTVELPSPEIAKASTRASPIW
jgi:hypothetical protein